MVIDGLASPLRPFRTERRARPQPAWPDTQDLAVCVDTMVAGVHFPADGPPDTLAHKLLAVNASDLAAMGAEPLRSLVSVGSGDAGEDWWRAFESALAATATTLGAPLAGFQRVDGPLVLTAELHGRVPPGMALTRHGAQPGDQIHVTGTLGDAAAALAVWRGELSVSEGPGAVLRARLDRPTPRLAAGRHLRGIASACIDVSDGLAADLGHILAAGGVGATVRMELLPVSAALLASMPHAQALALALQGGDDYELCFCVPPARESQLAMRAPYLECGMRCIGRIEAEPGLRCVDGQGRTVTPAAGWMHFR